MIGVLATILAGAFFLIGAAVAKFSKNSEKITNFSLAVAVGTMLVLILGDLGPEILNNELSWWQNFLIVAAGIGMLKILDLFVPEHSHKRDSEKFNSDEKHLEHIGAISLVAIGIHNFVEGTAIFVTANSDAKAGILMAIAVGLHNIPMGMMIQTTTRNNYLALGLAALSTVFGGIITVISGGELGETATGIMICLALGMALYIEIFELIPHVLKSESRKNALWGVAIGVTLGLVGVLI